MFARLFAPTVEASAHCDLPCGVYDPAQARIEAESIKAIIGKLADNDDPDFRTRAVIIKEQRSELVKHHLWVLWTDYFKPPHFEKYPQLHTLVNEATKLAGATGTKGSMDAVDRRRAAGEDRRDRRDLLGDEEGLNGAQAFESDEPPCTRQRGGDERVPIYETPAPDRGCLTGFRDRRWRAFLDQRRGPGNAAPLAWCHLPVARRR